MQRRTALLLCTLSACLVSSAAAEEVVLLWPQGAPGVEASAPEEATRTTPQGEHVVSKIHKPSLTVYLPAKGKATGAAVVIAPGGGHRELWMDHEGHNVAKWLSDHGVAGFVLKYRLARETGSKYTIEGTSLADTQRAIRLVKSRAKEWNLDTERIGVMGFSAGGELAALAGTRYDKAETTEADPIDKLSARPAFQALIYPAIPKEMPVTKDTPPAFLACGEKDRQNISQGLPELYLTMKKAGMSAELHVYANVGHGFGSRPTNDAPVQHWLDRFHDWMSVQGFLAEMKKPVSQ